MRLDQENSPTLQECKQKKGRVFVVPLLHGMNGYNIAFGHFALSLRDRIRKMDIPCSIGKAPPPASLKPEDILLVFQGSMPSYGKNQKKWAGVNEKYLRSVGKRIIMIISEPMWGKTVVKESAGWIVRDYRADEWTPKDLHSGEKPCLLPGVAHDSVKEVWDYNPVNMISYHSLDKPCRLVMPGPFDPRDLGIPVPAKVLKKDIDVAFYGAVRGTRRETVARSLESKGYKVIIRHGGWSYKEMLDVLSRSRIVPVVHRTIHEEYDPYRCQLPLSMGCLVVHDHAPVVVQKLLASSVVFAQHDQDILSVLEEWLAKPDEVLEKERQERAKLWQTCTSHEPRALRKCLK